MLALTPKQIVSELDRYIVGQDDAKRSVAIALRNRYRRNRLPKDIRDEITPKNIIMSGPTGVGKTEIARRIAKITGAPFVKVEATKFTEVGYVGRDVDSMVRDLVEASIRLVREEKRAQLQDKLDRTAKNRLIDIILPLRKPKENETLEERRAIVTDDLDRGVLEDYIIELEVEDKPAGMNAEVPGQPEISMGDLLGGLMPKRQKSAACPLRRRAKL